MDFLRFFKPKPPVRSPRDGSAEWQAFARDYLSDGCDLEQVHNGLAPGVIERLAPQERAEAERQLLARLAHGGDSRAAVGLGLLGSRDAVEPLRAAMRQQPGRRPFGSPAHAQALWRIARDPEAIAAVIALARDVGMHESLRMDAVMALRDMPTPAVLQALQEILQTAAEFSLRVHAFKGILMLLGYSRREADDHFGPLATDIGGAAVRIEARRNMMAKLAELTRGCTLMAQP